jgi:hypothetical protein
MTTTIVLQLDTAESRQLAEFKARVKDRRALELSDQEVAKAALLAALAEARVAPANERGFYHLLLSFAELMRGRVTTTAAAAPATAATTPAPDQETVKIYTWVRVVGLEPIEVKEDAEVVLEQHRRALNHDSRWVELHPAAGGFLLVVAEDIRGIVQRNAERL